MLWASNKIRLMPDEHMSNSRRWTMSKKLEGKIALITGGSRGIGAAIAKRLAAATLKHMKSGGRIIMIGSCVGERAMTPGLVPYSATKGAVKMFTQGLSRLHRRA